MKKNMGNRLLSLALALVLVLACLPGTALPVFAADTNGSCGDALTWKYDEDTKTLTISGTGAMDDYEYYSDAPWHAYCETIEHIVMENGLTHIGEAAFGELKLVTEIAIPNTVTSIGEYAINYCKALTAIHLPASVKEIGEAVFLQCSALEEITVDPANTSFVFEDGALLDAEKTRLLVYLSTNEATSYTIPAGVVTIDAYAFDSCKKLDTVVFPNSITTIGEHAFASCSGIDGTIILPGSITYIGQGAFYKTPSLCIHYSGTKADWDSKVTLGGSNADLKDTLQFCTATDADKNHICDTCGNEFPCVDSDSNNQCDVCGRYYGTCGENLTWEYDEDTYTLTISGTGAMMDFNRTEVPWYNLNTSIENLEIGSGVTYIGKWAFASLKEVKSVSIPDSVTNIGPYAFTLCDRLQTVTIPDSVTTIGNYAFSSCDALKTFELPAGVTTLGMGVFRDCAGLESITVASANTNFVAEDGILFNADKTVLIKYPAMKSGESYTVPSTVKTIAPYAADNCAYLETITIPSNVETIGEYAFHKSSLLNNVYLSEGLSYIEEYAFYDVDELGTVILPSSVTYIGSSAFNAIDGYYHYRGTETEWNSKVTLDGNQDDLNATLQFCTDTDADKNHICDLCGGEYPHIWEDSVCTVCGDVCAHESYENGICNACGSQVQAKIGETVYPTLAEAAANVAAGDTITLLTDVTVGAEETITFAAYAALDAGDYTVTCDGTVKIGESDGIIFENALYYHGGDVTEEGITLVSSDLRHTYYTAGDGYACFIPASGENPAVIRLHNATVQGYDHSDFSTSYASEGIWYDPSESSDLVVQFSGVNTVAGRTGYDGSFGIGAYDSDLTLEGEDGAVLNLSSGLANTSSHAISAENVYITGGTVNVSAGSLATPGLSAAIGTDKLAVSDDAVLNMLHGDALDGAMIGAEEVEGSFDALLGKMETDQENGIVTLTYCVYGNMTVKKDTTLVFLDEEFVYMGFAVPGGSSLTVNAGVTLDLSKWAAEHIDFSGTVVNNGTIKLPAEFSLDAAPKGGTVMIGDKAYTYDSENNKWVCAGENHADEDSNCRCDDCEEALPHTGGEATCSKQAVCDICGASYGELKPHRFTDVSADAFYHDPVLWAVERGITTGATETTFNPNGNCQRAAVVTFLWRAAGSPEPASTDNPFTDVKEDDFFYKAVLWAVEEGITNGTSDTEFSPYGLCNRAQVVTFLWRAQGKPASDAEVTFTDVAEDQFYTAAVAWAVENGITKGTSATEFSPYGPCNRAQVVTFLWRASEK